MMTATRLAVLFVLPACLMARSLTQQERKMADFARETFKYPGNRRDLNGYTKFPVKDLDCQDGLANERFAIWKNDATKKVVYGLRGTPLSSDPTNMDTLTDLIIARGEFSGSDHARRALNTLRAIEARFPDYKITMTGHSLGGTTILALVAQDTQNNVITQEKNQRPSSIEAAFIYNAYRGHLSQALDGGEGDDEAFYKMGFQDSRMHGVFVFGDLLSGATKDYAERYLPAGRLFVGYLPLPKTFPPISYPFAHNIDGSNGSMKLTSAGYEFGQR